MRRFAVAFLAAFAVAAPAQAATGMEIALQDDPVFLHRDYYDRDVALAQARDMGVTRLRVALGWAAVNREQADSATVPVQPAYDFSQHDALIDAAATYGIRVQLNVQPPAPAWATGDRDIGVERPNPKRYGQFVRAVAEHFKGRVDRYAIWNEPSHVGWLTPQKSAAAQYRQLYTEGYRAVKRVDPAAQVLIGELVPYDSRNRSISPLLFMRQLTCTASASGVPGARGYRLRKRGKCSPLRADGVAHHPYEYRGPPERTYPGNDNVTIGTLGRMTSTLAEMARLRVLLTPQKKPVPVYITEFGYFGTGRNSHPDLRRASYLRRAYQIAQRNPMVRQMTQYLFVRPPRRYTGSYFDMSIVLPSGEPLAPYKELARWSKSAARSGKVVAPTGPIPLPPAPPGA